MIVPWRQRQLRGRAHEPASPPLLDPAAEEKKRKKKERKIRSAWISFGGRIVAQFIGAAASVILGIILVGRLTGSKSGPTAKTDPGAGPTRPEPSRLASVSRPGTALAVLPLENLSGDPQQEYFADGMTEALITDLAKIRSLRVISRTSVMQYKGARKPLPEIARELGVDAVVEGSVVQAGGRVRVTAQLVDAATDEHLWAESYERPLRDVLGLQAEVAGAIARKVNAALTPVEQGRLARSRPVDPEAYSLYLRGRHAWDRRTPERLDGAVRYFEQAIGKDPACAVAYAGLADTYSMLGTFFVSAMPPGEAMGKARAAAEKALALDDGLAEAHTSLAWVRYRHDWDWDGAEAGFRRAIELNPGYATAHHWYATFLGELGRHQEALTEAGRALEVDPLSPSMHRGLAFVHYLARRFGPAETEARKALEADPESVSSRLMLGRALGGGGDLQGAIAAYEGIPPPRRSDEALALLGNAYGRTGRKDRAREMLERLRDASRERPATGYHLALVYLGLGETDPAFRALDRAVEERSTYVLGLKAQPLVDPLRSDPRFPALLRRVGLPGV